MMKYLCPDSLKSWIIYLPLWSAKNRAQHINTSINPKSKYIQGQKKLKDSLLSYLIFVKNIRYGLVTPCLVLTQSNEAANLKGLQTDASPLCRLLDNQVLIYDVWQGVKCSGSGGSSWMSFEWKKCFFFTWLTSWRSLYTVSSFDDGQSPLSQNSDTVFWNKIYFGTDLIIYAMQKEQLKHSDLNVVEHLTNYGLFSTTV